LPAAPVIVIIEVSIAIVRGDIARRAAFNKPAILELTVKFS
jgi:hypothetical protein